MSKTIPAALLLFFCLNLQPTSTWGQGTIQPSDSARNRQEIQHDLMIEFATAKRDLAKNELERKVTNADAYPKFFIDRLRAELNVAEEHLSQILVATSDGETALRRRHATEQLRLAKLELESGKKLRRSTSNFSDLDLQSLKLKYKIAKLKIDLIDNPLTHMSMMDAMEKKMHRFSDEILALEQRIARLENPRK
ncbi:MAG: hypothetical protein GY819_09115 [Planctomycetaceae bacterium]|nr:hypothetical protein [Planctomycetaceae bacterium]